MDRPFDITAKSSNLDIISKSFIGDFLQSVNCDFQYPCEMDWFERIIALRKEQKMSRAALARAADVNYDVLNKIERGDVEQPRGETLPKLAKALGTTEVYLRYGNLQSNDEQQLAIDPTAGSGGFVQTALPILGEVAAGMWLEASLFEIDEPPMSHFRPVTPYPASAQYLLRVNGESLNKIAQHGDLLLCVDYGHAIIEVKPGDLAVIERTRDAGHTIERTAKRVVKHNGKIELLPESDDPRFQEPVIYDEHSAESTEVRVIAKIVQVLREV